MELRMRQLRRHFFRCVSCRSSCFWFGQGKENFSHSRVYEPRLGEIGRCGDQTAEGKLTQIKGRIRFCPTDIGQNQWPPSRTSVLRRCQSAQNNLVLSSVLILFNLWLAFLSAAVWSPRFLVPTALGFDRAAS
jgi:hypothetical protein